MNDKYLDQVIKEKRIVTVLFTVVENTTNAFTEVLHQGMVISYSELGVSLLLLDGSIVWININRINRISEMGGHVEQ